MKTTYLTKVMGLIMIGGCLTTYLFIDNYNQKKNDNNSAPKKITYEEVYGPALDEVHSLIAAEKTKNSGNSVFSEKSLTNHSRKNPRLSGKVGASINHAPSIPSGVTFMDEYY